jgi:hypothetical protein
MLLWALELFQDLQPLPFRRSFSMGPALTLIHKFKTVGMAEANSY